MSKTQEEIQEQNEDIKVVEAIILELEDIPKDRIVHILKTVAVWCGVENQ